MTFTFVAESADFLLLPVLFISVQQWNTAVASVGPFMEPTPCAMLVAAEVATQLYRFKEQLWDGLANV